MAQQDEGWPLGLQPLHARIGVGGNRDNAASISFNTVITVSPFSSSTDSSSDLDTEDAWELDWGVKYSGAVKKIGERDKNTSVEEKEGREIQLEDMVRVFMLEETWEGEKCGITCPFSCGGKKSSC
ncbi:hypothetical protein QN277_003069 [Acacia crassicarpa]|uniref:Uncharacterized protein n=1 Tax=Acacia crassicarpa TaxID=499986 RepID=A0AAE1NAT4_9FABA|nr:hypothetical protein QN277_003069 [Acacia crassicarpa]